ncbi:sensor histidine kinase [Catellatospora bangladeshensis]|uniref:sensor histidine kinase n=1 Tax=Catellatospora bangladeshensis TaxID=310355 RepID=UPI0036094C2B
MVARLRAGHTVDVDAEVPPATTVEDELHELENAFAEVQRTAVGSAVQEATLRAGLNQVFLNIGRRSQLLLHRQLALLDAMERRVSDPQDLEDLYRIDHLGARMRRHAEDLVILAGAVPGRGWRHPVPLHDVVRSAVSEVEEFTRITVVPGQELSLRGRAVSDVVHLLAELLENATAFSPRDTNVLVSGQLLPNGYAVEIEDRGVGMPAAAVDEANARLADPPDFDPAHSSRLGLFVVARLAARHGIRVTLRPSPYGGLTAVVLLPVTWSSTGRARCRRSPRPRRPPVRCPPPRPRPPRSR